MKTLRVLTLLLLPFVALAQNAPFPPASTSDVVAGTERNKFVSPYTLSQAGFSSPTGGITAAVATNIAAYQAQIATNGLVLGATVTNDLFRNNVQVPSTVFGDWSSAVLILTNGNSIQDSNSLAEASIGNIGTTLGLYYISYDGGYTGRIWAAYGSFLNGFTKHGIVLSPTAGQWDASSIGGVTHYREGITNYLYYFGGNNAAGFEVDPLSVGVAYSTDGTNYTKHSGNPIMRSNNVAASCVTCYTWFTKKVPTNNATGTGKPYLGFFNAKHSSGATERIHLATADNPLGPWTYYGEIFHHTNAAVTSDFTIADLPNGGYMAAYWMQTNGAFQSGSAFSTDLTNWIPAGDLFDSASVVGTRLGYDDGLFATACISVPGSPGAVYVRRPKKSNLGDITATIATAGLFYGDGANITNVRANTAQSLISPVNGLPSFGAGTDNSNYYWWTVGGADTSWTNEFDIGYDISRATFFTPGTFEFNGVLITNASPAIATNNASATDGMALVKRGNNLKLETISGSGSVTFNANQFGSSAAGTNILSGALFTNAVNRIADETIFLTDSSDNPLMSWDSDNTDLRLFANVVAASGGFVGHGGNVSNLNASQLSSGTVPSGRLNQFLTLFGTNAVQGTNFAVLDKTGSFINGIGLTNNNLTVPGNLGVAGTFTVGTTTTTQLLSTATGNTNRMPVWGPNGNLTNVSLVNLTLDTGVFPATLTANTGDGFEFRMASNNVQSRIKRWRIHNLAATTPTSEGVGAWSIVGGTGLNVPGTSTRMNHLLTYSAAATNSDVYTQVQTSGSCATNFYYWTRVSLTNITQLRCQFGFSGSRTLDEFASLDSALFRYSTAAGDTTWKCITANGGATSTTNNSGVTVTADAIYDLAMLRNGASIVFYINGTSVATNTTTLPDDYTGLTITFGGRTLDASTYAFRFFGAEGWLWQY